MVGIFFIGYTLQAEIYDEFIRKQQLDYSDIEAEDKSKYYPQYELPKDGKPICINERATQIASVGKHILVLQLDDWDKENGATVIKNINKNLNGNYDEKPLLDERNEARTRHTFLDMCETSRFLKMMKKRQKSNQIFLIPFHIKETLQHTVVWENLPSLPKQGIIDQRSAIDKANVRLGNNVSTFKKTNCDVWADRPQLISYEISTPSKWVSSIARLRRFQQILQIVPDEKGQNLHFIFYNE